MAARTGPLKRLACWHRRLRYESARRPRGAWTRRLDLAIVISGVMAILAILLTQRLVHRPDVTLTLDFRLVQQGETLRLVTTSGGGDDVVTIVCTQVKAGWPITTARIQQTPHIAWRLPNFVDDWSLASTNTPTVQPLTPLRDDLVLNKPARAALASSSTAEAQSFATAPHVRPDLIVFAIMTGVWWIVLYLLCLPILGLLGAGDALTGKIRLRLRRRRRRSNRCERCGYSLTGLDYSANCPECGHELC